MQVFNKEFESFLFLKGLQPVTVLGHINSIRRIVGKIGYPSIEQANELVADMYKSDYSYSYKVNTARTLEYWMEFSGQPVRFGRQRKPRTLIKETMSESEVNRLFFVTRNIREKSILSLLAYSGIRPKELCRIHRCDVNIGDKSLFVEQGKGFKDGFVELAAGCIEILLQYISSYPVQDNDYLFHTLSGKQYNQCALRKLIKVLAKRAGLNKRVYPYLLRHSFATNMVKRGAHILYVKKQLRHVWIDTTMIYLNSIVNFDSSEKYLPKYI